MSSVAWMAQLERWLMGLWYGDGPVPKPLLWLSVLYRWIAIRRQQRLKHTRPDPRLPVIVVGNLVVGGSGKSPLVASIAKCLIAQGHQVAIICRGYQPPFSSLTLRSNRALKVTAQISIREVGDEAMMLADQVPCPVWVSRDRRAAYEAAIAAGAEVVVSDDGLQHGHLPRSFEVCVFDGQRLWGNGHLLPAGPLREPLTRMDSVDAVLLKAPAKTLTHPHEVFELVPSELFSVGDGKSMAIESLRGQEVLALCGISHPEHFLNMLTALGMSVVPHIFRDHHAYTEGELNRLPQGLPIVTTEKDWIKIKRISWPEAMLAKVYVLKVNARLPSAFQQHIIQHVREFLQHD